MKLETIKDLLDKSTECPSKWELETIIWADRNRDPNVLIKFLKRIDYLYSTENKTTTQEEELAHLLVMLEELDEKECISILSKSTDIARDIFIENLARRSAIEILCLHKLTIETMTLACKLSPNDFILCAKRSQDLIDSISGLAIKGEKLSKDIAGA